MDVSRRSLEYAREAAAAESLPVHLIEGSYLEADLGSGFDAAILIYEDYCALSPAQRLALLHRVRDALGPGGHVLFDVTSATRFPEFDDERRVEEILGNGFWAPPPYLGVKETWTYPELRLVLERYVITTRSGSQESAREGLPPAARDSRESTREFWNWMQCLTPDQVEAELREAGFAVDGLYGDAAGTAYAADAPTFAVVASAAAANGAG